MQAHHFDHLTRALAGALSRRQVVKGLAGTLVLGLTARFGRRAAAFDVGLLDLAWAALRTTDPGLEEFGAHEGILCLGLDACREAGVLNDRMLANLPLPSVKGAYSRALSTPVGPDAPREQTVTTTLIAFDADVTIEWFDAFDEGYFAGTEAPSDVFDEDRRGHTWSGQTSDDTPFEAEAAVFKRGSVVGVVNSVRFLLPDDRNDPATRRTLVELTDAVDQRTQEILEPSHEDYAATLGGPIVRDRLWIFASYGVVGDETIRSVSHTDAAHDEELERNRTTLLSYTGTIPIPIAPDADRYAYVAGEARTFRTAADASEYFASEADRLAADGSGRGFRATLNPDAPEFDFDSQWFDYFRPTEGGEFPGAQVSLLNGDQVATYNVLGGVPVDTAAFQVSDEYYISIRRVTEALANGYQQVAGDVSSLDDIVRAFQTLQVQCLDSPNLCQTQIVIAGTDDGDSGASAGAPSAPLFDFPYAAFPPRFIGDLDLTTAIAGPAVTFFSPDADKLGDYGLDPRLIQMIPREQMIGGHASSLRVSPPGGAPEERGVEIATIFLQALSPEAAKIVHDAINRDYLDGVSPAGTAPDVGDGADLFEWSGDGFNAQAITFCRDATVVFRAVFDFTDGGLINLDHLVEHAKFTDDRVLRIARPDYGGLGGPIEDTHIFNANFYLTGLNSRLDGGFQLEPPSEMYVAADGWTLTQYYWTEEQTSKYRERNRDATAVFSRWEQYSIDPLGLFTAGIDSSAIQYGDPSSAMDAFRAFPDDIEAAVQEQPDLEEVLDPEAPPLPVEYWWFRYARTTEGGVYHGNQVVFTLEDRMVALDIAGPVPLAPGVDLSDGYQQALDAVTEAAVAVHLARSGLLNDPEDVLIERFDEAFSTFIQYMQQCAPIQDTSAFATCP